MRGSDRIAELRAGLGGDWGKRRNAPTPIGLPEILDPAARSCRGYAVVRDAFRRRGAGASRSVPAPKAKAAAKPTACQAGVRPGPAARIESARADLRRRHRAAHRHRHAELFGDRGARRLADACRRASASLHRARSGPDVALLRQRLAMTDDLPAEKIAGDVYDDGMSAAVRRFQARHGLPQTGTVGPKTLAALNVPVTQRLHQLAASLDRLAGHGFRVRPALRRRQHPGRVRRGGRRRQGGAALRRAGRQARPALADAHDPHHHGQSQSDLDGAAVDPQEGHHPQDAQGPGLSRAHAHARARRRRQRGRPGTASTGSPTARRISPSGRIPAPGTRSAPCASTCRIRIRSTCTTPTTRNSSAPTTASSRPAARASTIRAISPPGCWRTRRAGAAREIDAGIATGQRSDVRLAHKIPVAWIYLTGWATRDGTIHFRDDVYGHDKHPARPLVADARPPVAVAARASGFVLQSADPRAGCRSSRCPISTASERWTSVT